MLPPHLCLVKLWAQSHGLLLHGQALAHGTHLLVCGKLLASRWPQKLLLGSCFCGSCKRAWVSLLALNKGLGNMAKWKRKKHDVPEEPTAEEHLGPLGLALLEQFAHGMFVSSLGLICPMVQWQKPSAAHPLLTPAFCHTVVDEPVAI